MPSKRHGSERDKLRRQLVEFPGHETLVAWVRAFRDEMKKLRHGAARRWIKHQNVSSRQRAERRGTDIVTVNRLRRNGHVDGHTTVPLDGAPQRVLAALIEVPWSTWWRHSDTEVLERDSAQRIRRFVIHPLGKRRVAKLWVEIALDEPRPAVPEDPRIVIAADFSGSFNGRGRLEIEDLGSGSRCPEGAPMQRCRLGIHWPDFIVSGDLRWLPALAIVLHGNTLEGQPFVLFGNASYLAGTGFDGLRSYLAAPADSGCDDEDRTHD